MWEPGLCEASAFPSPQYLSDSDPSPGEPFFLAVGAVHEHSAYSDGDPFLIPRDYFAAANTGHNTADTGGDTGVRLDFMMSSEHSDNEKLPITTSADCIPFGTDVLGNPESLLQADFTRLAALLDCSHAGDSDHYFKWLATLQQAMEATEVAEGDGGPVYTGFTAMRGFEWTNDYYNHLNVYFSRNVVNAKTDGSYLSMAFFWNWLREPVEQGGGADALVTFNHPGGDPHLTPFDGGLPHGALLQALKGGANWNDVAYVPDVDRNVVGIEVNGGDDIEWYVKALTQGWHLGPVAAEDEHQREWATVSDGKTLILTRGRSPRDYYFAMRNHRTAAVRRELLGGSPGTPVQFPKIYFFADGADVQTGMPLGSVIATGGSHRLQVRIDDLPVGVRVALLGNHGGQGAPIPLVDDGAAAGFTASHEVAAPAAGEDWYFVVLCPADEASCGSNQNYLGVTAPIWLAAP